MDVLTKQLIEVDDKVDEMFNPYLRKVEEANVIRAGKGK